GNDVPALHHDLVTDTRARGIEVDAMLFGEGFDSAIFFQVRVVAVLDVVVESEHNLVRVVNFFCADTLELAHHRGGVVMGHHAMRADGNEVSSTKGPPGSFGKMRLSDLFNDGLRHMWCLTA